MGDRGRVIMGLGNLGYIAWKMAGPPSVACGPSLEKVAGMIMG